MQNQNLSSKDEQQKFYGYLVHSDTPAKLNQILYKVNKVKITDREMIYNKYMFLLHKMTSDYTKSIKMTKYSVTNTYNGTILNIDNWSKILDLTYLKTVELLFDLYENDLLKFNGYLGNGNINFKLKNDDCLKLINIEGQSKYKVVYDRMSELYNTL